jgi:hypothetical protein
VLALARARRLARCDCGGRAAPDPRQRARAPEARLHEESEARGRQAGRALLDRVVRALPTAAKTELVFGNARERADRDRR